MINNIIVRPEAESDLDETFNWYKNQKEGLGNDFLIQVDKTINLIQENPMVFQNIYRNVRRAIIHRFPYGIYYVTKNSTIIIIAIFHAKSLLFSIFNFHFRLRKSSLIFGSTTLAVSTVLAVFF